MTSSPGSNRQNVLRAPLAGFFGRTKLQREDALDLHHQSRSQQGIPRSFGEIHA
jgi:hypothetical protein